MTNELIGFVCAAAAIVIFIWAIQRKYRGSSNLEATIAKNAESWKSEAAKAWLSDFGRFWRGLGFFEKMKDLSDPEFAGRLQEMAGKDIAVPFNKRDEYTEISILMLDPDRFWFEDTEADVCMENKVYVRILSEWAKISRGAFNPQELHELWHSDKGPIEVHFKIKGQSHTLRPEYNDDWFDLPILIEVNKIIKDSGTMFYVYVPDQCAGVIALTKEEHALVKKERKIKFDIL